MFKKLFKQFTFIIIFLSHFGFIAAMLMEEQNHALIYVCLIVAISTLVLAYILHPFRAKDDEIANMFNIVFVFFGAITTYVLHDVFNLSTVLAAALVGLLISFVPEVKLEKYTFKNIPIAVYCGTFVGMTSISIEPSYAFICLASLLTGLLLIGTKNAFQGLGGKLGTFAFGGVLLAFFITSFIKLL